MAVNLVAFFDTREQLFVVVDLQVRMDAALHEDARAAQLEGFFDLLVDDVIRENVGLVVALDAIERAKGAELLADVRVVDIPVDDVADDVPGMPLSSDAVC